MRVMAWSTKGSRSEFNEDAYFADNKRQIFVVADGVGSGPDGHEASRNVVESISEALTVPRDYRDSLAEGLAIANTRVNQAAALKDRSGMASTVVCLLIDADGGEIFHSGDSRVYRMRQGNLAQLTTDHSKTIKRDGGERSVVTRAIGARPQLDIERLVIDVKPSDVFLLMSDGISDPVADATMKEVILDGALGIIDKCRKLVHLAEQAGGQDDKTIIYVEV